MHGLLEKETNNLKFLVAIFFSVFLHALFLSMIPSLKKTTIYPIEVRILTTEKKSTESEIKKIIPTKQIISHTEAEELTPPEKTKLLSEKNARTEKEQIRRGVTLDKKTSQHSSLKTSAEAKIINKLRLSEDEISKAVKTQTEIKTPAYTPPKSPPKDSERAIIFEKSKPFHKNTSLSFEKFGSADFLPDIPDGEITLLNAKADRHAVFVRRVATQVFASIRKLNWAELAHHELNSMRGFVTITATMSKKGALLSTIINESSGSKAYDNMVLEAVKSGAWDQNPPEEATFSDGNIHFIFKSRAWARFLGDSRLEQRWLILGTGLR